MKRAPGDYERRVYDSPRWLGSGTRLGRPSCRRRCEMGSGARDRSRFIIDAKRPAYAPLPTWEVVDWVFVAAVGLGLCVGVIGVLMTSVMWAVSGLALAFLGLSRFLLRKGD